MRFAMFDQMEQTDVPVGQMYRDRLDLLEVADEAGFWCYFKAEHHLTPLDMTPSTSTWLAAVAARTTNIRIGSLVYLLPFHHPLRLLEEVTTLDHLSNGRLELGVGAGISPPEHELWGMDPAEARPRFEESLAVLLAGFTDDSLTFHGDFFDFDDVPIEQRCLQEPYPQLWYPGNIELAGPGGFNTVVGGPTELLTKAVARFRELAETHRGDPGRVNPGAEQSIGASVRVILHADENQALERGRVAWKYHDANLRKLWTRFDMEPRKDPTAGGDFDKAVATCRAFAGTPEMLIDFVSERAKLGIDPLIVGFEWGDLSTAEVRRSLEMFIEHVMPVTAAL